MNAREIIRTARIERCGFLTPADIATIAADPATRLQLVLVRCGAGRFLTPAQDAAHFIAIIERDYQTSGRNTGDYIRDVSLPAER